MKSILVLLLLVQLSVQQFGSPESNCLEGCVCGRIFLPVCDVSGRNSGGKTVFSNQCIAECHMKNCPSSKFFG